MDVVPVPGEPVLLLEPGSGPGRKGQRVLVVADLHLGLEASLRKVGMHLPSQTTSRLHHLLRLVKRTGSERLVLLGDVKHTIGGFSVQEREELPRFFEELLAKVKEVDVVVGNHDGCLKEAAPEGVRFHQHLVIDNVGLTHGHSWPPDEVMECEHVIMGHDHPTILFLDELGQRCFYPAWVRAKLDPGKAGARYKKAKAGGNGLIMPAFDDLGCGTPLNLQGVKLLGPLLANGVFQLATATVHLVDGTFLGELKDLTVADRALVKEQEEMGPSGPADDGYDGPKDEKAGGEEE